MTWVLILTLVGYPVAMPAAPAITIGPAYHNEQDCRDAAQMWKDAILRAMPAQRERAWYPVPVCVPGLV